MARKLFIGLALLGRLHLFEVSSLGIITSSGVASHGVENVKVDI